LVGLLALTFSLVHLATYSSVVLLIVFSAVNLALWKRGKSDPKSSFARWSNWGLMGFIACFSLLAWQIFNTNSSALH
jgi:predicted Zn-dependent protease